MRGEIIKGFLELNPELEEKDLLWRMDGRLEWICKHGVGHTVYERANDEFRYVHGCDGCCKNIRQYED